MPCSAWVWLNLLLIIHLHSILEWMVKLKWSLISSRSLQMRISKPSSLLGSTLGFPWLLISPTHMHAQIFPNLTPLSSIHSLPLQTHPGPLSALLSRLQACRCLCLLNTPCSFLLRSLSIDCSFPGEHFHILIDPLNSLFKSQFIIVAPGVFLFPLPHYIMSSLHLPVCSYTAHGDFLSHPLECDLHQGGEYALFLEPNCRTWDVVKIIARVLLPLLLMLMLVANATKCPACASLASKCSMCTPSLTPWKPDESGGTP